MSASRAVCALLSMVALSVAGCGGGGDAQLPSDQQGLGEEIKQLGGMYYVDKNAPESGMFSVNLSGTKADDAVVAKFADLAGLKHLKLNGTQVTDACVATIKKIKTLETLDIGNTKITVPAVESLRTTLPELEISYNIPPPTSTDSGASDQPVE